MAKSKIKVSVEIYDMTKAYVKFVEKGIGMGLRRGGIEMERDIKKRMKKGKAIRVRGKGGKFSKSTKREASKPGDPPAVQQGPLRASIGSEVVYRAGGKTDQIVLRVGTENIKYALWLDQGTTRMAARPFVGPDSPTFKKFITGGELLKSLEEIWKKMLRKKKNLGKGKKV
tara:strand:+ start:787 stop:1299 length:513 start_codon:yes stop_codon:yes gene_type:complete